MLVLKDITLEGVKTVKDALQIAIKLEHSTIPPYLTANFTLTGDQNAYISNLIGSIVGEEMLHLSIACNLLNAIGGHPVINKPEFVPKYPGHLPGTVEASLIVGLMPFSMEVVEDTFMVIEEPENPGVYTNLAAENVPLTIGAFYEAIKTQLILLEKEAKQTGKTIFVGKLADQLTYPKFFPEKLLFPITDIDTAIRGINIIVDQGEGTSTDPFVSPEDEPDSVIELAHYYRFEEITKGKALIKDPSAPKGYSYSGEEIPFDPTAVARMWPNPRMNDYPVDTVAFTYSKFFNFTYTSLLNSLHRTFNGEPEQINAAMGLMFSLRLYALKLLQTPDPNHAGYMAGPSFEFVTNEDLTKEEKLKLATFK